MSYKIHFTRSNAKKFRIKGGTEGFMYPSHPKGQCTIARINMRGRYPVIGYSVNTKCSETIIMLKGTMKIRTDDTLHRMRRGDLLTILPRMRYRIEGNGEVFDIITPGWDKKQNKIVPDPTFTIRP